MHQQRLQLKTSARSPISPTIPTVRQPRKKTTLCRGRSPPLMIPTWSSISTKRFSPPLRTITVRILEVAERAAEPVLVDAVDHAPAMAADPGHAVNVDDGQEPDLSAVHDSGDVELDLSDDFDSELAAAVARDTAVVDGWPDMQSVDGEAATDPLDATREYRSPKTTWPSVSPPLRNRSPKTTWPRVSTPHCLNPIWTANRKPLTRKPLPLRMPARPCFSGLTPPRNRRKKPSRNRRKKRCSIPKTTRCN